MAKRHGVFASVVLLASLVAACQSAPDAGGTAADASSPDAADTLVAECRVQLNLSDSGCACVGERARLDLTPKQQEMVVAQVTNDREASDALQAEIPMDEIMIAMEWMNDIPVICEQQ